MSKLEKILENVKMPSCLLGAGLSMFIGWGCVTGSGNGLGGGSAGGFSGGSLVDSAFVEGMLQDNRKDEMRSDAMYESSTPREALAEGNSTYLGNKKELEEFISKYGWSKLNYKILLEKAEALLKSPNEKNRALFLKAYAKQKLGLHDEAISCYDQYLSTETDPAALYNRGLAKHSLGRLEDALADYEKSIALKKDEVVRVMLLKCMYKLCGQFTFEEISEFLDAVKTRDLEKISEYHKNRKPEDFSKLVRLCAHYHHDLKMGIAAIWMNAEGHVISNGLTYDAPNGHTPPLIVTLEHFAETLGIEKTVTYLTGFYGKKTTLDQMNTFVRTHSAATFEYGLSGYFLLLSKEEAAKLEKGKILTLRENPPHYRNVQILARDIPPEEKLTEEK